MHPHNRWFGQAEVLADHAALTTDHAVPPPVAGHLQHSWDLVAACEADLGEGTAFLWGDPVRARLGHRPRHVVVGAPWLYLLARDPADPLSVPDYRSPEELAEERLARRRDELAGRLVEDAAVTGPHREVLFLAEHGLGGSALARELAREVLATGLTTTVVLSPSDFRVDVLRDAYTGAGLPVTTLADRVRPSGVTGPNLLESFLALVRTHRVVAANRWHTAHLLGAAAGLAARLLGPAPVGLDTPTAASRELGELADDPAGLSAYALRELGRDHLLTPPELTALFDWTRRR